MLDARVVDAGLTLAADRRAPDHASVLGILVLVGQLGASPSLPGVPMGDLFTARRLSVGPICGFQISIGGPGVENPLPVDYERRIARVIDGIMYAKGEPDLLQDLARCARSSVDPDIPPQVDVSKIRLDHVCGNKFRIQNHTPAYLVLSYVVVAPDGSIAEEADVTAPAISGWTSFTVGAAGTVRLTYDGQLVATAANIGQSCGGAGN